MLGLILAHVIFREKILDVGRPLNHCSRKPSATGREAGIATMGSAAGRGAFGLSLKGEAV
jgi:hypothetical protein